MTYPISISRAAAVERAAARNRRWFVTETWAVRTPQGWTVVASQEPPRPGRYGSIEVLERA